VTHWRNRCRLDWESPKQLQDEDDIVVDQYFYQENERKSSRKPPTNQRKIQDMDEWKNRVSTLIKINDIWS